MHNDIVKNKPSKPSLSSSFFSLLSSEDVASSWVSCSVSSKPSVSGFPVSLSLSDETVSDCLVLEPSSDWSLSSSSLGESVSDWSTFSSSELGLWCFEERWGLYLEGLNESFMAFSVESPGHNKYTFETVDACLNSYCPRYQCNSLLLCSVYGDRLDRGDFEKKKTVLATSPLQ